MFSVSAAQGIGEGVARVSGEPFGSLAASLSGLVVTDHFGSEDHGDEVGSDLALLSAALEDALDARSAGVLVGLDADEVALRRAERRARRADAVRALRSQMRGGVA